MPKFDKQIHTLLRRIQADAAKSGVAASRPYLLADHLALLRIGQETLDLVKNNVVTYVDNPATHWVLNSFKTLAPAGSGADQRAATASKVMDELVKANKTVDAQLKKTQEGIAQRIDQRIASSGANPDAAKWFDNFRAEWDKQQPMDIKGNLDFDGYPDSPASPSPKRYLNSFMSLIDSLPDNAEVVVLSGSPAILNHIGKFTEEDGNVHMLLVDKDSGVLGATVH